MKGKVEAQKTYWLGLTEEEAQWLRGYMQNAHAQDEREEDEIHRGVVFSTLLEMLP